MKKIIILLSLIVSIKRKQSRKKESWVKNIFKYSTIYGAYSQTNSIQATNIYCNTTNELIETTRRHPSDMMVTYGLKKAFFQYENRNKFYDGSEKNNLVKSNIGAYKGLEYLYEYSRGRQQGRV